MKRIGVIGCGIMGRRHAEVAAASRRAKLHAVCDLDRKTADEVAAGTGAEKVYVDYEDLIADPAIDAVHIALPDHLHTRAAVDAMAGGKDVLVEKPLATEAADAELMAETAIKTGRLLMVNFSNRWMDAIRRMKKIIGEGRIGKPSHFWGMLANTTFVPLEMLGWSSRTSPTFFLLPHVLDLAGWLLGGEAEWVCAAGTEGVLESKGVKTHDTMAAVLSFSEGATAVVETAWILPRSLPAPVYSGYRVVGSSGMIIWDRHAGRLQVFGEGEVICDEEYREPEPGFFTLSLEHFFACLEGEETPVSTAEDGVKNTRILCGIIKSAGTGEKVSL